MTSREVESKVKAEIAGRWDETNAHGVDLRVSLMKPEKIRVINRSVAHGKVMDEVIECWLILEEDIKECSGYKIVFDESRGSFGLASAGFRKDRYPGLCGFYGDFWTTFHAM